MCRRWYYRLDSQYRKLIFLLLRLVAAIVTEHDVVE